MQRIPFFRPAAYVLLAASAAVLLSCGTGSRTVRISSEVMRDKIKGGWVGQTVGVCYGRPTEFRWPGAFILDYTPLEYNEEILIGNFNNDDLYMDLSFLSVLDSMGLDATGDELALKFANAGFNLWHANQAGRWNILHGIMPPESGHWKNNPHADDIDFQIEADFIGLLCPALPATALEYCDRVGHITNYGDGVYGGLFVAAMYCHAYVEKDIAVVVEKALLSLPPESEYRRCISDVVSWWRQYPDDWHECWFQVQRKWAADVGCPNGALQPFNIDAKLNGAYIAIGLLYGGMDFGRTLEIATRCGQDSDCNPSNAGGILGTLIGFSRIPDEWKTGLDKIEDRKFDHCDYSLNDVYEVNYRLAGELVTRAGGSVGETSWIIKSQDPVAPERVEVGFEGLTPVRLVRLGDTKVDSVWSTSFSGRAFVVDGAVTNPRAGVADCEVLVDGRTVESVRLSGNYHDRRTPLFWNYDLEPGEHELVIRKNSGDGNLYLSTLLTYE